MNAFMPAASISSGPSTSTLRLGNRAASSSAKAASAVGVSSFGGAFTRSRQRFAQPATTPARRASSAAAGAPGPQRTSRSTLLAARLPSSSGRRRRGREPCRRRPPGSIASRPRGARRRSSRRAPWPSRAAASSRARDGVGVGGLRRAQSRGGAGLRVAVRVHQGHPAALAAPLAVGREVREPAAQPVVEDACRLGKAGRVGKGEDENVRLHPLRRRFRCLHEHGRRMLSEPLGTFLKVGLKAARSRADRGIAL